MDEPLYVKICGVTRVEDAESSVEAGASAIGVNLVPGSKRRVDEETARRIAAAVGGVVEVVAVVAGLDDGDLRAVLQRTGAHFLQLHGHESPATLCRVLPRAFKAVRIGGADDVVAARAFGGERILADAKVDGELGGTGALFDWALVRELARERRLILAGGLRPENVAEAVRAVAPFGVDVASGVESSPGIKDLGKVRAFIDAARAAAR
jgi:phosphoribosylanthranilate isomerase